MKEWRYRLTIFDLGTRWMSVISFSLGKGLPVATGE
jgi:hypothetical protein